MSLLEQFQTADANLSMSKKQLTDRMDVRVLVRLVLKP
jgi:hypothetical protein